MHAYVCVWRGQGNLRPVFICAGKDLQNCVFWHLLAISQFNGAVCCWAFKVLLFGNSREKTYSETGPRLNAVYLETLTSPCCITAHVAPTLCHVKVYPAVQRAVQSRFSWHVRICCTRKDILCTEGFSCKQTDQAKAKLLSCSKEKSHTSLVFSRLLPVDEDCYYSP